MTEAEIRQLALIVGLQRALLEDGHDDPEESFAWAVRQGLIKVPP